jgi:LmbE family N-acetylglucosaminyl deacetylase
VCALIWGDAAAGVSPEAPPIPKPDERYKSDVLLIVAHPDDEVEIAPYLAKAVLDEHKRVAVIYATRGSAGGNRLGMEQGAALGAVREIEARRALAALSVVNV